jgi:hypothetical protein
MGVAVALRSKFSQILQVLWDTSGNLDISTLATGSYIDIGGKRIYTFTTAITANSTLTSAPAGSIGVTTHATGRASIFVSDGTKWQFLTNS